jgi:hypothetical protein
MQRFFRSKNFPNMYMFMVVNTVWIRSQIQFFNGPNHIMTSRGKEYECSIELLIISYAKKVQVEGLGRSIM